MTEAEWLACEDPKTFADSDMATGDRKWRLTMCACARRIWKRFVDHRSRRAVERSEQFADGLATAAELTLASLYAEGAWFTIVEKWGTAPERSAAVVAVYTSRPSMPKNDRSNGMGEVAKVFLKAARRKAEQVAQADIIRDIFGNPFRPVTFSPSWRTDTTLSLASQMYESRDFSAMPILADALQDAGCDNDDVLNHCRGPGPHVRGCWVVDLVLGKE